MNNKCFILIGPESSGNHIFLSLFSNVFYQGNKLLGTDLANIEGKSSYRFHEYEYFNNAWVKDINELDTLCQNKSFVTGRSIPCGKEYPDVVKFYNKCIELNYDPLIVIISRDYNIVKKSTITRGHPDKDLDKKINFIEDIFKNNNTLNYKFINYESIFMYKNFYFDSWLKEISIELSVDFTLFSEIKNANKKYLKEDKV